MPDDFEEFYQGCYGRVVALAAAVTGDRQQAEDIAQEAFARALARWPKIAGYDLPEAWVRRVALRLAVDLGRRMRRAIGVHARLAASASASASASAGGDPLALGSTAVGTAMMRLPLRQRQVLVLYYLADLPVDVIARECGIPAGTVRTRLAAGRRRLERELRDDPEEVRRG